MEVNSSKTKVVIFGRGRAHSVNYRFKLGTEDIETVSEYRYLGILFNYVGRFRKGQSGLRSQRPFTHPLENVVVLTCQ